MRFLDKTNSLTQWKRSRMNSQEMDSMMSMMHSQINRAISSARGERVIPEVQNTVSLLPLGIRDTESGWASNNQENRDETTGFKTKITEKDCMSFDLRDTKDLVPYSDTSREHSPRDCI